MGCKRMRKIHIRQTPQTYINVYHSPHTPHQCSHHNPIIPSSSSFPPHLLICFSSHMWRPWHRKLHTHCITTQHVSQPPTTMTHKSKHLPTSRLSCCSKHHTHGFSSTHRGEPVGTWAGTLSNCIVEGSKGLSVGVSSGLWDGGIVGWGFWGMGNGGLEMGGYKELHVIK